VVGDERTRVAGQLARFGADLGLVGVKVDTHVGVGSPVAELLARATETQPDLIVLGSHAREGIGQRLLGTVADRMLRHAETPVLLLPREAREPWTRHP
jgi:nucleotide-binding universal stress UspA family protein